MKLINSLILITLLFTIFSVNADSTSQEVKGEAIITVANKTFTLALQKCHNATNTVEGKFHSAFVIATHQSRKSKEPGHRFSAIGSKTEGKTKASYRLQVDGGFSKGGTGYRGKMPFKSFKDNKLFFEGKSNSIRKENKKPVKGLAPINIKVTCNE